MSGKLSEAGLANAIQETFANFVWQRANARNRIRDHIAALEAEKSALQSERDELLRACKKMEDVFKATKHYSEQNALSAKDVGCPELLDYWNAYNQAVCVAHARFNLLLPAIARAQGEKGEGNV